MSVFCYFRHHTNPVGTEWKWKMDDPDTIVNGAMENHRNMIKQFRGMFHVTYVIGKKHLLDQVAKVMNTVHNKINNSNNNIVMYLSCSCM